MKCMLSSWAEEWSQKEAEAKGVSFQGIRAEIRLSFIIIYSF